MKVPHLIKHIHHEHIKPIHLYKVHAKKAEHYHHDDHEDTKSSWKLEKKKTKKGNQKIRGSFSNLKPITLHHKTEEHTEYPGNDEEMHEFDHNQRVSHRLEFEHAPRQQFSQEDMSWNSEDIYEKQRPKYREDGFNRGDNFKREHIRPKPIEFSKWLNEDDKSNGGYSGEDWGIPPNKEISFTRKQHKLPATMQFSNNERNNRKTKQPYLWSKEASSEIENEGWKPMVEFNAWKNFDDMENHRRPNGNHNNNFMNSEEYKAILRENLYHSMQEEKVENNRKKKRNQNKKKNKRLSKPTEDFDENGNHEQVNQKLPQHPYQIESPKSPILPQIQPQFFQPLQTQQIHPYSIPISQEQKSWPQPHWPVQQTTQHLAQQSAQQSAQQPAQQSVQQPAQQPAGLIWQTHTLPQYQTQPQPQPTIAPKMVWSGHHLQMPQHSMWHIQQHSDGAPPLQVMTVGQNPLQTLQFHQPHSLPQQLTQGSSPVHRTVSSSWPLTGKSQDSSVKQQWEQHVQTSGSDGPASSYRVEVINYTDKKSTR